MDKGLHLSKEGCVWPPNNTWVQLLSAWDFLIDEVVKIVEEKFEQRGQRLKWSAPAPLSSGNKPEMDISDKLNDDDATTFQQLIGFLRWACELGCVDILIETSLISSYICRRSLSYLFFHQSSSEF